MKSSTFFIVLPFLLLACNGKKGDGENVKSQSLILKSEAISKQYIPTRFITKGTKHHWFGYYDKLEFDPSAGLFFDDFPQTCNQLTFNIRRRIDAADSDHYRLFIAVG